LLSPCADVRKSSQKFIVKPEKIGYNEEKYKEVEA